MYRLATKTEIDYNAELQLPVMLLMKLRVYCVTYRIMTAEVEI